MHVKAHIAQRLLIRPELGYNLAVNARSSLDFSWRKIRTTPDMRESLVSLPSRYSANQYSLVYLLRF